MTHNKSDILVERSSSTAWVRVNRPDVRNALSFDLAGRLIETLDALNQQRDVRVIVLSGSGNRAFISGADITEFNTHLATAETALVFDERFEALNRVLETISKPVIASIQGPAVGSGLFVALACDVRIAAEATKFGVPVAKIGLIPSLPDISRLARFAGLAKAKRLLFTGEFVEAGDALSIGLIDQVVAREQLEATVRELAEMMAARAPLSLGAIKKLTSNLSSGGVDVSEAGDLYHDVYSSRDFREGVAAFLERRPPVFEGR